jgi:hypothetical protein
VIQGQVGVSDSTVAAVRQLFQGSAAVVSIPALVVSIAIGIVLSLILRWHFRRFSSTLGNREQFSQVFPFVLLTTVLVITIVKSSLALSLGLVGALSIVRFRTPIKEPEELAYLFMAIAIGLGLGANQTLATVVATLIVLGVMARLKRRGVAETPKNLYVSIDWRDGKLHTEDRLRVVNAIISEGSRRCDLRRLDVRDGTLEATYFVDLTSADQLAGITQRLRQAHEGIGITFIDQNQLPSV